MQALGRRVAAAVLCIINIPQAKRKEESVKNKKERTEEPGKCMACVEYNAYCRRRSLRPSSEAANERVVTFLMLGKAAVAV
jgi:hypothetical protein